MMSNLISIVADTLSSNEDYLAYCREIRENRGLTHDASIWIPNLDGSTAHRLGAKGEKTDQMYYSLANICSLMHFDQNALIACVKSMQRWEKHNGRWDRDISLFMQLSHRDAESMKRFITATN